MQDIQVGLNLPLLERFINETVDKALPSLKQFVSIPNITKHSYGKEMAGWKQGYSLLKKAADHLSNYVNSLQIDDCKCEVLTDDQRAEGQTPIKTPLVFATIEGTIGNNESDAYFFYGHYDKQPPMGTWTKIEGEQNLEDAGPYNPVLQYQNGVPARLYGRGIPDDAISVYVTSIAIKALQTQGIPHPRIIMLVEGDEESGSGDVQWWINKLIDEGRIHAPKLVIGLDGGGLDYNHFFITNSLRGGASINFELKVMEDSIHSGAGGGVVPTLFSVLRTLLSRIQNQKTGQMPLFDVQIPEDRQQEITNLIDEYGPRSIPEFPVEAGVKYPLIYIEPTIKLNTWRAHMEVLSIEGYPKFDETSNVITPWLRVKLGFRLPPTLEFKETKRLLLKNLTEDIPHGVKITYNGDITGAKGFNAKKFSPGLKSVVNQASKQFWGTNYVGIGTGGSVPMMNFLQEKWPETDFISTGLMGPGSNAHGPDECLDIKFAKQFIGAISYIVSETVPVLIPSTKSQITRKVQRFQNKVYRPQHSLEKKEIISGFKHVCCSHDQF